MNTLWPEETENVFISSWQDFLNTDLGKRLVPTWEEDL